MKSVESGSHLLLTCVHYHDTEAVARFVAQVNALPLPEGRQVSIAIADNSGDWDSDCVLPPNAHLYRSETNSGYLSGCAFAYSEWTQRRRVNPDWTGICNTDLTFDRRFFLNLLEQPLPGDVGVLAPGVHLPDGTPQNPFLQARPGRARIFAYTIIYRSLLLTDLLQRLHSGKNAWKRRSHNAVAQNAACQRSAHAQSDPRGIYAAHGSLFFLRDSFFLQGGTLEYPGFLYGEELFIAEQARRMGLKTLWMPGARVEHSAHAATKGVARRRKMRLMWESARIAWQNDFRHPA